VIHEHHAGPDDRRKDLVRRREQNLDIEHPPYGIGNITLVG